MKKIIVLIFIVSLFSYCGVRKAETPQYKWGIDPELLPRIVKEADFPKFEPGSADKIWGLAGKDLGSKDLTNLSLAFLAKQTFDQNTRWPRSNLLPEEFSPKDWLKTCRDPGLATRELHRQGVTGKGVSIAVIDKPIRPSHREFKGRISYFEVFENEKKGLSHHFHGIACTSILAGEKVGVAPGAKIHYFAIPDRGKNFHFYSAAVNRIIDINRELNDGEKIRIISISDGIRRDNPYKQEWDSGVEKLQQAGIEIIYSTRDLFNDFIWGGCPPFLDRNVATNYDVAVYFKENNVLLPNPHQIIVPGDYRTTALNMRDNAYVYWGEGAYSWAIPYIAGLAALAWQLNPDLSFAEIKALLRKSAVKSRGEQRLVSPIKFIDLIRASQQK